MKQLACWQLVAGCLWMAACAYVNCISQIYVDKFQNEHYHGRVPELLPDLGFYFLPHIEIPHLADFWNIAIVVGTMVPVLLEAVKIVLGIRFTCGDILFSGHAANFTLMALIWTEYGYGFLAVDATARGYTALEGGNHGQIGGRHRGGALLHFVFRRLLPVLWWAAAILGYFVIVATRFHYTVDVLVAIIIVTKQWGLYHMYIRTPRIMRRLGFLRWYEQKQDFAMVSAKKTPRVSPVGDRRMSIEMGTIPEHPDLEALEAGTQGVTEEDEDDARNKAATTAPQLYGRIRSTRFGSDYTDIDDTFVIEDSASEVLV
ncbi:hypothetical protein Pmar_PMAR020445 [Perkinsus marinus ATCC 50983]|uniref:Sphingomyelin synthase-like domain-containing protein n=1 Tax=Perkinsus marinus (strain ATCC 50983 / TXsc) TaxID=423536 RepID=C5L722_PERM5|nr:hypothetical protein Pmar_PMAR020445 [Perkinsus marinus ATCC 50983]EER07284.1 hypothetical protein Pmar_PMAR020445 [Perkinsus marinus ATCC 50983]|eukprot:XP_002775468.1 hypothetical protein Pmar_PMAR020445 [Perkinsus marinus ATCC 50983]